MRGKASQLIIKFVLLAFVLAALAFMVYILAYNICLLTFASVVGLDSHEANMLASAVSIVIAMIAFMLAYTSFLLDAIE